MPTPGGCWRPGSSSATRPTGAAGRRSLLTTSSFFNGLGDAIAKLYGVLNPETRILMASPSYTTHSSAESSHAHAPALCFSLDPNNRWYPDLGEIRNLVKANPAVAGIMIINPDNPTGMAYPVETLKEIVAIAREYDLFILADEVYNNIVYNGEKTVPISDVIGDVPAIAMKGISKELPWPGSRCGWIEAYNFDKDERFQHYVNAILNTKMNEVCSTTLPQKVIPAIMSHPQYPVYLEERTRRYELMSNITWNFLKDIPGLMVNRTNGAFYMAVAFRDGMLTGRQSLPITNTEVRELVESLVNAPGVSPDKRFVYYVLAATGICIVPLSSFNTGLQGFRVTLLEKDPAECERIYKTLADMIKVYIAS
nr:pyridoxal phosphate-dependent aminotransferase [Geobacter sp. OR-1]